MQTISREKNTIHFCSFFFLLLKCSYYIIHWPPPVFMPACDACENTLTTIHYSTKSIISKNMQARTYCVPLPPIVSQATTQRKPPLLDKTNSYHIEGPNSQTLWTTYHTFGTQPTILCSMIYRPHFIIFLIDPHISSS